MMEHYSGSALSGFGPSISFGAWYSQSSASRASPMKSGGVLGVVPRGGLEVGAAEPALV
jgi:hypothetical protein